TGGLDFGGPAHFNVPNIVFARACSEPNRDHPRWSFQRICDVCWRWLAEGKFQCESIVSPVVPFEESVEAYRSIDTHPERSIKLGVSFR
ncbi:MAG: alcohol dehydrogenase, partial [Nitrospirae bacterium]